MYIYICKTLNRKIAENVQICYLKFHAMNDDFQEILKLSYNSKTLILNEVCHVNIATNCYIITDYHCSTLSY